MTDVGELKKFSNVVMCVALVFSLALPIHINIEEPNYPTIYEVVMWLAIAYPTMVVALYQARVLITSYGLVGIFMPSTFLLAIALHDYRIDFNPMFLLTCVVAGSILWLVAHLAIRQLTLNKFVVTEASLIMMMGFLAYTAGAYIFINCYYDNTTENRYRTAVIEKLIGKRNEYKIVVTPWKSGERTHFSISEERYDALEKGDTVTVIYHHGRFGTAWFDLDFANR